MISYIIIKNYNILLNNFIMLILFIYLIKKIINFINYNKILLQFIFSIFINN